MTPIVEVEHLVRRFGDRAAVDDISFEIAPGEVFGLLGPNGAGKTTTIRVLMTLIPPTSGIVRVAGRVVVLQTTAARTCHKVVL